MTATRAADRHLSLEEINKSVRIPEGHWWRRMLTFAGPAYMVSVGYMDPGNWATDLEGGARFGYRLLWILLMSNMMAVLLQTLAARLGLVTGRDLAQACRDRYSPGVRWILFILCEIAIAACDLAEVLGTAIGLNLLFGIPLTYGVIITAFDVFILLAMQRLGIRKMEAFILTLVSTIGICFLVEIILSKPAWGGVVTGFVPGPLTSSQLYVAIGILGATVMPHNLYLHSSLVQSRAVQPTEEGVKQACRFNLVDSVVALNAAFFVNAAILIVAAAAFWTRGIEVTEIQQAHKLLEPVLGSRIAPAAFAIALICAGQSSTLTGTLAGQITMEGFLRFRMRPWVRRLITRSLAVIPAVIVIGLTGEQGTYRLLILSQVILSLQLPFAVVPLVKFTSSRRNMGGFASPRVIRILAWTAAVIIIALNARLVFGQISEWAETAASLRWAVLAVAIPIAASLGLLLLWMAFRREDAALVRGPVEAGSVVEAARGLSQKYDRIGVALEALESDAGILAAALGLARSHKADLVLMHVVEGVGGQWYGNATQDAESREDELYLESVAERLRGELAGSGAGEVRAVLGYGNVRRELKRLIRQEGVDLLIVGSHGHRGLSDLIRGETVSGLRHAVKIPVFSVRRDDSEKARETRS